MWGGMRKTKTWRLRFVGIPESGGLQVGSQSELGQRREASFPSKAGMDER